MRNGVMDNIVETTYNGHKYMIWQQGGLYALSACSIDSEFGNKVNSYATIKEALDTITDIIAPQQSEDKNNVE